MTKDNIILIFMLFISYPTLFAQHAKNKYLDWNDELKEAYNTSINSKSLQPLEEYLNKQNEILQVKNDFLLAYYGYRFKFFHTITLPLLSKKERSEILSDKGLQVYLQDLKKYKEHCADCYICGLIDKYKTYQTLKLLEFYQTSDIDEIFSKGFKKSKEGPGLNIKYVFGNRNFFGVEYSFKAFHDPSYTIKEQNAENGKPIKNCANNLDFLASYSSIGLNYNPSDKHTQIVFNAFSLINPLLAKPLQVGLEFTPMKNVFFYKPEFGLGYKGISLSMGYNVVFRNELRSSIDKWSFTAGFTYVMNN